MVFEAAVREDDYFVHASAEIMVLMLVEVNA